MDADDLMAEMVATAREHTQELGKIEGFSQEEAEALYEIFGVGSLKIFPIKSRSQKKDVVQPTGIHRISGQYRAFYPVYPCPDCGYPEKGFTN